MSISVASTGLLFCLTGSGASGNVYRSMAGSVEVVVKVVNLSKKQCEIGVEREKEICQLVANSRNKAKRFCIETYDVLKKGRIIKFLMEPMDASLRSLLENVGVLLLKPLSNIGDAQISRKSYPNLLPFQYKRPFPEAKILYVAKCVFLGLSWLFIEHKICHRDVKPENILVKCDGSVKVPLLTLLTIMRSST